MSKRKQARRDEIARAAIAPLSERGYRNVRLADIGESLGMTGAHLLYYFDSKADLFLAALRIVEQDLRDSIHTAFEDIEGAHDRWDHLVSTGAPVGLHDSGLLMWLQAWSEAVHDETVHAVISELEDRWQGLLREVLEYGLARGELDEDLDIDDFVEGCAALLDGLTLRVVVGYRPVGTARGVAIFNAFAESHLTWHAVERTASRPAPA